MGGGGHKELVHFIYSRITSKQTIIGGIAPNHVIARSNLYGVNVTKAVIGAYM